MTTTQELIEWIDRLVELFKGMPQHGGKTVSEGFTEIRSRLLVAQEMADAIAHENYLSPEMEQALAKWEAKE